MTGVGVEQIAAHVGISFELRTSATAAHQDIRTFRHQDKRDEQDTQHILAKKSSQGRTLANRGNILLMLI